MFKAKTTLLAFFMSAYISAPLLAEKPDDVDIAIETYKWELLVISEVVKSETITEALISLLSRGSYNLASSLSQRLAHSSTLKALDENGIEPLPENIAHMMEEAFENKQGTALKSSGYSKIIRTMIGEANYRKCLIEYKQAIKDFYIKFLNENNLNDLGLTIMFDTIDVNESTDYTIFVMKIIHELNVHGFEIDEKDFYNRLMQYLGDNKKTFSCIIKPYLNKKSFCVSLFAGATTGLIVQYIMKSIPKIYKNYDGNLLESVKKGFNETKVLDIDNPEMALSLAYSTLPINENSSGLHLWKNGLNVSELKVMDTQKLLLIFDGLYFIFRIVSDIQKDITNVRKIFRPFWVLLCSLIILGTGMNIYDKASDLYEKYFPKEKLKALLEKLHIQTGLIYSTTPEPS